MQDTISGRVYKFGDNVNSDIIIAGRYLIYIDPVQLAEHAFEMLGEAQAYSNETFTTEALTVVGVAFIVIAYPASLLIRALERRLVH